MKKLLALVTLFLYVAVSTGFVISVHYCMDQVSSFRLGAVTQQKCSKCGMPVDESKGCCKDELKVVKLQADQVVASLSKTDFSLPPAAIVANRIGQLSFISALTKTETVAHGPPLCEEDIYLQNRVFRI